MQPIIINYTKPLLPNTETLLRESTSELLRRDSIWRSEKVIRIGEIDLAELDRIGGKVGYGGSRVFVGAVKGKTQSNKSVTSNSLLLKIVENNARKARSIKEELDRYNKVKDFLEIRFHARPLSLYPTDTSHVASRILWSEFVQESAVKGIPTKPPQELQHLLEAKSWKKAAESMKSAYLICEAHMTARFLRFHTYHISNHTCVIDMVGGTNYRILLEQVTASKLITLE